MPNVINHLELDSFSAEIGKERRTENYPKLGLLLEEKLIALRHLKDIRQWSGKRQKQLEKLSNFRIL